MSLETSGNNIAARPAWTGTGLRLLWFFLAAAMFALTTRVAEPIAKSTEMFHEGEYVGSLWHMKSWQAGKAPFPLLIHGAMDYVPSQVARAFYGNSRIIGGTRVVNTLLVALVWVLFMELVYQMSAAMAPGRWRLGLAMGLFSLMAPPWFSQPVQVTEAFTGVRDVFLLAILLIFICYWKSSGKRAVVLAAAGAALLPLAISWSYDRGIIAVGFTGFMFAGMAFHRRWPDVLAGAGALLVSGLVLERTRIFGTLGENASNIFYWIRQSGVVWGLPFELPETGSVLGVLLIILSLGVAVLVLRHWRNDRSPRHLWIIAGLLVIQFLLAKSSLNRPASNRVLMALFPSVLILVHFGTRHWLRSSLPDAAASEQRIPDRLLGLCAALFGLISILIFLPVKPFGEACQTFVRTLIQPRTDLKLVPPEVATLGLALRDSPDPALFGWCNEGVLHLLARKPWATRFPYAVYAGPAYDAVLLKELQAINLQGMVIRPGEWSMKIDGRSMAERLPAVDHYIKSRFTIPIPHGSYVLLNTPAAAPPGPAASVN